MTMRSRSTPRRRATASMMRRLAWWGTSQAMSWRCRSLRFWSVERMFFDLKEVLNLNRLYAANPHAVAMQVYAAAIVYNALRVAQSDGAAQVGWAPERLSPAKFFPKVATATYLYLHRQQWEREIRTRYRHLHLRLVGDRRCWVRTTPAPLEVEIGRAS